MTNEQRKARGQVVLATYRDRILREPGEADSDALTDLLTDLAHRYSIGTLLESLKLAAHHRDAEERGDDGARHKAIGELAHEELNDDGEVEIDNLPILSEGDDNGTYVLAWAWLDFSGTPFDKEKEE